MITFGSRAAARTNASKLVAKDSYGWWTQHVATPDLVEEVTLARKPREPRRGDARRSVVLQLRPVELDDLVQVGQVEQPEDLVHLVVAERERRLQPLEHRARHRASDLDADDVPEAAAAELELDRLQQVVGLVRQLEVGIARDPEGGPLDDLHARKEQRQEVRDCVLHRHEAPTVAESKEARQHLGHLDPREPLLRALRIARQDPERERETGDVRERLAGADAERREDREDVAGKAALELVELLLVQVVDSDDLDAVLGELWADLFLPELRLRRRQVEDPAPNRVQRLPGAEAVGRADREAGSLLIHQAGNAHHEELVEVRREEATHLHALEQRQRLVRGQFEQPRVVLDGRQLAVQQPLLGSRLDFRRHSGIISRPHRYRGIHPVTVW